MNPIPILSVLVSFYFITNAAGAPCNETQEKEGAFINVCGLCVAGNTGFSDDEGLDDCGICFGGGGCIKCKNGMQADGCMNCINEDDPSWNKCTRLKYVSPEVADLAVEIDKITFTLFGINFTPSKLGELSCQLKPNQSTETDASPLTVLAKSIEDKTFIIEVDSRVLARGAYSVLCKSSNIVEVLSDAVVLIVDSRKIALETVSPQTVKVGMYFRATFSNATVSKDNLRTDNLICFLRNKKNAAKLITTSTGYLRNGTIFCDDMITLTSGTLKLGVASSFKAALQGAGQEFQIEARPVPLSPISASFSTDLRQLLVIFNQNIEDKKCEEIFTGSTKRIFGGGWDCWVRGNKLIIQLGKDAKVRPGSLLFLRHNSVSLGRENFNSRMADLSSSTVVLPEINNQMAFTYKGDFEACKHGSMAPKYLEGKPSGRKPSSI